MIMALDEIGLHEAAAHVAMSLEVIDRAAEPPASCGERRLH